MRILINHTPSKVRLGAKYLTDKKKKQKEVKKNNKEKSNREKNISLSIIVQ